MVSDGTDYFKSDNSKFSENTMSKVGGRVQEQWDSSQFPRTMLRLRKEVRVPKLSPRYLSLIVKTVITKTTKITYVSSDKDNRKRKCLDFQQVLLSTLAILLYHVELKF